MIRLIVTRPEPDATRTGQALSAMGYETILSPVMVYRREPEARLPKRNFRAVLFTSANGVRAYVEHPERALFNQLPAYTVGDRTAVAARRAGFDPVRSAGADSRALSELIISEVTPRHGALLHVSGRDHTSALAEGLLAYGFTVATAALYHMDIADRLLPTAVEALNDKRPSGLLIYSPRTAAAFALLARRAGLTPLGAWVTSYCLSDACSNPLRPIAAGPLLVADAPDQLSLFALLPNKSVN